MDLLADWKTTLSGWITLGAAAIHTEPSLVSFLPDTLRQNVVGIAGLVAVVSGAAFAYHAKDKDPKGHDILPIGIAVCLMMSSCAWGREHKQELIQTLEVIGKRAAILARDAVLSAAISEADKGSKADYLDAVAQGLRANAGNIVTSDDVAAVVKIWTPQEKAHWETLAGEAASITSDALQKHGKRNAGAIVETVAKGLNQAAATVR